MKNKKKSTYYFLGRLSPIEFCVNFNPGEIHFGNNWALDIYQDGISIWIPGTKEKFDVLKPLVIEAFDLIVTLFTFITNIRLSFTLQNWVEAMGVISKRNMTYEKKDN